MDLTFERYHDLALRFLSYRPRSEKEVIDYLKKKRIHESIIDRIIKSLKEKKFLNDIEFAEWWIEQRTGNRPKSFRIIKMELRNKGIGRDIVDGLSEKVDKNLDEKSALKLLDKHIKRFEKLSTKEVYRKLFQLLARRGFDFDLIKKVIDKRVSP
ncbi:MAG: hypothetical protein A2186_00725 [Candidatus Levybacteria bacterium RIFOXYA1_FULL_41_10]|nr:MAG: Regulatory protein RecX [Candidatus Levybacteria bacterium GW2011_GWA1_39_34]KKR50715.1 MAG: Regulatory protein RecX [Candidatus Levybacteria bacterium GW2011_GWC1_40_19]KKR95315.1 MAG: Regulatory protein RecX [Candidatus Levybacteria bacterium GW2011_GWA2_41_15]KKS01080.1 MAG: Regulatory protein RecX [Candidatus Levybacteria bacterium GW2011_GWB1_41_21]OGH21098.1 MAG: hypothetical protein A2695_01375 [Candidatus Levybacteria bacterium RIFCSPHIGHO2_01_FULL_40_83]OGH25332.1 MAG: hypothe